MNVLPTDACLCQWIAEISGTAEAEVRSRLADERRSMGANVLRAMRAKGLPLYVWNEALADFYAHTDAFLYETPVWNGRALKAQMRGWIGDYLDRQPARQNILTYGDGLGFDSLYLAKRGHHVTYYDVSNRCRAFAERLFRQADVPIQMVATPAELADRRFDVVVCLDVLEHVPRPEELVAQLADRLGPEGRLIVSAPFYFTTRAVATHLKCNRRYSGDLRRLYGACGLTLLDGRPFWDPLVLARKSAAGRTVPRAGWAKRGLLRYTGLWLAVARWWNLPHNLVAQWLTKAVAE